ncbi:MAG: imelysin family protein [Pseudomonadota bacterium]
MRLKLTCVLLAVLLPNAVAAEPPDEAAFARLTADLVASHVLPRYAVLRSAAGDLQAATTAFCTAPDATGLAAVREAFQSTSGAWAAIEHVRFGPIEFLTRHERMSFWPDRRNATSKALTSLIGNTELALDQPRVYINQSAAGQGLPAIERLLFSDGVLPADFMGAEGGDRRCAVLRGIVGNVAAIASDTASAWLEGDPPFKDYFATVGEDNAYFATHAEGAVAFVKSLMDGLYALSEVKLVRPLGASPEEARPRRAEQWRSGRTLAIVSANLNALVEIAGPAEEGRLAALALQSGAPSEAADIAGRLQAAADLLATIDSPLDEALADPDVWAQIDGVRQEIAAIRTAFETQSLPALGLSAGFNRFDGD